jgi:hypothetical protein
VLSCFRDEPFAAESVYPGTLGHRRGVTSTYSEPDIGMDPLPQKLSIERCRRKLYLSKDGAGKGQRVVFWDADRKRSR